MISARYFLLLVAAGTAVMAAGPGVEPAAAQEARCKLEAVTATGRAKFRPFTKTKELEGRGSAMSDAIVNWQRKVGDSFGENWRKWSDAKETSFECAPTGTGKIIGTSLIGCTITGKPCAADDAVAKDRAVVTDIDEKATRGKHRRERPARRLTAEELAYEREMDHQRRLAERRQRTEDRAYEREVAHQKRLQRQRDLEEEYGWKRQTARAKYEADRMRRRVERDRYRDEY